MNDRVDTVKAAVWSLLAALALSLHVLLAAPIAGPQLYGLLAVLGFGLLLPPISTLYMRFTALNQHAAILTALNGTAMAIAGIGALTFNDLEPAALLFLGMWWWVVGKFSAESGALPRTFGYLTMALSLLAFAAMVGDLYRSTTAAADAG
ncbi:MAG: hypothetical protein AUH85_01565 [Chloroflexi bacterium 13_1_40CM_4_68_4]|nr:MAG: hypothetical protein AUH85_01565 [Chloroflexi bacterium 13_1_40CM_4_68_4]